MTLLEAINAVDDAVECQEEAHRHLLTAVGFLRRLDPVDCSAQDCELINETIDELQATARTIMEDALDLVASSGDLSTVEGTA